MGKGMTRRERWEARYWKLQKKIVPELEYSQSFYERLLAQYVDADTLWLDAGTGQQILPEWENAREQALVKTARTVIGVDLEFKSRTHTSISLLVRADIEKLPFADNSFNLVTCNMVVEHLENPVAVFKEFHRVLTPGGHVIIHTPNIYGYVAGTARLLPRGLKEKVIGAIEGRSAGEIFPAHYRANTSRGLDLALTTAGLRRERFSHLASTGQLLFSLILLTIELHYLKIILKPAFKQLRTSLLCVYTK